MDESRTNKTEADLDALLSQELASLERDIPIGESFELDSASEIAGILEVFIPRLLRKKYLEWEKEGIDGIFAVKSIRTGKHRFEICGVCVLITDQTLTPFNLAVESGGNGHSCEAEVRVGTPGAGRLGISGPSCNSKEGQRLIQTVGSCAMLPWVFEVSTTS